MFHSNNRSQKSRSRCMMNIKTPMLANVSPPSPTTVLKTDSTFMTTAMSVNGFITAIRLWKIALSYLRFTGFCIQVFKLDCTLQLLYSDYTFSSRLYRVSQKRPVEKLTTSVLLYRFTISIAQLRGRGNTFHSVWNGLEMGPFRWRRTLTRNSAFSTNFWSVSSVIEEPPALMLFCSSGILKESLLNTWYLI